MHGKELHDFLFKLYDFADLLSNKIEAGDEKSEVYFLTLVYIEQIFDTYGRGLVLEAAREANDPQINPEESLAVAHKRIDILRARMASLIESGDFDQALKYGGEKMFSEWHKRS